MIPNPYSPPPTTPDHEQPGVQKRSRFSGCAGLFFLFFGGVGGAIGSGWIYTFGLTDYRAHLAYMGLPLGVATLFFSLVFIWFGFVLVRPRGRRGASAN